MSSIPWFIKHKPKRFTEVEFSDDSSFKVLEWLRNNRNGGLLYITGPTGVGKTSLVHMVAKVLKFKVFEYSEIRADQITKKTIENQSIEEIIGEDHKTEVKANLFELEGMSDNTFMFSHQTTPQKQKPQSTNILNESTTKTVDNKSIVKSVVNRPHNKTISGESALILIDESDFSNFYSIPKFTNITVIYTSTANIPEDNCIKIRAPDNQLLLKSTKKILKLEHKNLEDLTILKLCKICNSDLRSILSYAQLFSSYSNFKESNIAERSQLDSLTERIISHSISYACKAIFSKRLNFNELEKYYSEKTVSLCLNSMLSKSNDKQALKCYEIRSSLDLYSEKYKFLTLYQANKISMEFKYHKEEQPIYVNKKDGRNAMHFLPFFKRSLQNKRSVEHLQKIFKTYKIDNLTGIDKEISNYRLQEVGEVKTFRYKYVIGSSSAVKRDISISDLNNI